MIHIAKYGFDQKSGDPISEFVFMPKNILNQDQHLTISNENSFSVKLSIPHQMKVKQKQ